MGSDLAFETHQTLHYQVWGESAEEREAEKAEEPVWTTVCLQAPGAGDHQPLPEQIRGGRGQIQAEGKDQHQERCPVLLQLIIIIIIPQGAAIHLYQPPDKTPAPALPASGKTRICI